MATTHAMMRSASEERGRINRRDLGTTSKSTSKQIGARTAFSIICAALAEPVRFLNRGK
jgi:hypothetical protein